MGVSDRTVAKQISAIATPLLPPSARYCYLCTNRSQSTQKTWRQPGHRITRDVSVNTSRHPRQWLTGKVSAAAASEAAEAA